MKIWVQLFMLLTLITFGLGGEFRILEVSNPLNQQRLAAPIAVPYADLGAPEGKTITGMSLEKNDATWPVPFQLDDLDQDGSVDELFFQLDMQETEKTLVRVEFGEAKPALKSFPKRVHAVIESHPRDPWVVYKPAWESELMAYCTYGAAQIDCIGKTVPRLTLNYFYGENPHPQHTFSPEYGHDFLMTGNTMAAHSVFIREKYGTIARPWTTNSYSIMKKIERDADYQTTVISDGPLRSLVKTTITNWQTDKGTYACELLYSIAALQRHTSLKFSLKKYPGSGQDIQLGAGMKQIFENVATEKSDDFMMTVARDVLEAGILNRYIGLGIITPGEIESEKIEIPADDELKDIPNNGPNIGIVFPKGKLSVEYAFVAAWEKDGGITSSDQWRKYLTILSRELSNPIQVRILASE